MQTIKIGVLGLGTVGGGTISVLHRNAAEISRRAGCKIEIAHVADRDYDNKEISGLDQVEKKSADPFAVVNDPEISIIVELIGGYSPAKELVLKAIENGKHVVTANKALIALHGNEIFVAAQKHGVSVAFEAAVAGGIPIIKIAREGLVANHIQWIAGIINGTGNFILTEMENKGKDFTTALQEAQQLGYAEADPSFDVEGIDAAHKLTIMGSIAFGIPLQFDKIYVEGIANIDQQDVAYASQMGYRIKHLGITRKTERGIEMRVHPTLIPQQRLIANVNGVMNAVLIKGDAVGATLHYGAGAGAEATASSVIADLVDIVRQLANGKESRVPHLAFQPDALQDTLVLPMEEVETAYYLRIQAVDRSGVLADVTKILGDAGISIEAILQKQAVDDSYYVPVVLMTQRVREKSMNEAIAKISDLPIIEGEVVRIRMESLQ